MSFEGSWGGGGSQDFYYYYTVCTGGPVAFYFLSRKYGETLFNFETKWFCKTWGGGGSARKEEEEEGVCDVISFAVRGRIRIKLFYLLSCMYEQQADPEQTLAG